MLSSKIPQVGNLEDELGSSSAGSPHFETWDRTTARWSSPAKSYLVWFDCKICNFLPIRRSLGWLEGCYQRCGLVLEDQVLKVFVSAELGPHCQSEISPIDVSGDIVSLRTFSPTLTVVVESRLRCLIDVYDGYTCFGRRKQWRAYAGRNGFGSSVYCGIEPSS